MDTLWYFAYGSNLSADKFTKSRGIIPLATVVARIPGWTISMSIPGLPYREPAFASIRPIDDISSAEKKLEVEGVAYLITRLQYAKIIASEGGDITYAQAKLRAEPLGEKNRMIVGGEEFLVITLANAIFKASPGRPSFRYLVRASSLVMLYWTDAPSQDLVLSGAKSVPLTPQYLHHLQMTPAYTQSRSIRKRIGASLFLAFWSPVMTLIEVIVKKTASLERGGAVPDWVKTFVRFLVASMWFSHEMHALLWGRGDGLDDAPDINVAVHNAADLEPQIRGTAEIKGMPWTG